MLKDYMRSLADIRKLSPEEEAELWRQYKEEESQDARQKLIENYQLLVCREAMRYRVQESSVLDLVQEGMVGLMEAAERFDPSLQVAFSLYAVHRIRGRMLDFLKTMNQEIPCDGTESDGQSVWAGMTAPDLAFETADRSLLHSEIDRAMRRLPEKEQDILRHVFIQERTAAETAEQLDVSTAYVYRLEKRGIRRLRGMLSRLIHERKQGEC